jgi:inosose dehydratase
MSRHHVSRRDFTRTLALGLAAGAAGAIGVPVDAQTPKRKLAVGHTGITWGFKPPDAEVAIKDVASLGFSGYESFGNILEAYEAQGNGGLKRLLDAAKLPLRSAYCDVNLTEPDKRKDEIAKIVRWGQLIKQCGGKVAVVGPNGVKRQAFNFAEHKANIVASLNDIGKALNDIGIVGALHQHTGTCVETRDETYAVVEAMDTRHIKFGPDVGQLQKGGSDPVKVVKDFQSVIHHVHLKDFDGGEHWLGYCPLGQGKVDLAAIVGLLEASGNDLMIMAELDPSPKQPLTPLEAARINKTTLQKLGYAFRA